MFFLFSDVLVMAKPRPPLHLLQSGTFVCRAVYPMAQCHLQRVFGHSGGPCGGLLSVSDKMGVLGKVGEARHIPQIPVHPFISSAWALVVGSGPATLGEDNWVFGFISRSHMSPQ